jgi:hypothetical protein
MLFEDESLDVFNVFTLEDLYQLVDVLLEDIDDAIFKNIALSPEEVLIVQESQLRNAWKINIFLSELYRRNRIDHVSWLIRPFSCVRCRQPFEKKEVYTVLGHACCYDCSKNDDAILADKVILCKKDETEKQWDVLFSIKSKIKNDYQNLKRVKQYMLDSVSCD